MSTAGGRWRRALAPARWQEYAALLRAARDHGYAIVSLEPWVLGSRPAAQPTLVLRHDVDQAPRAAVRMAAVEAELDVRSTWYFRWRTADRRVIARLRREGHAVGFHYETLTRAVLEGRVQAPPDAGAVAAARRALRRETLAFARRHGPVRSIAAHGDTRLPDGDNGVLAPDEDPGIPGVAFDANAAMPAAGLALWMTDRPGPGDWSLPATAERALAAQRSPVLCLTHPHHWASGRARAWDRLSRHRGDSPPVDPWREDGAPGAG